MAVELQLLPLTYQSTGFGNAHAVIPVPAPTATAIGIAIERKQLVPDLVPLSADIFGYTLGRTPGGECCYGRIRAEDNYGRRYTWATASQLVRAIDGFSRYPTSAASAYLSHLPGDTLVILEWH